MAERDVARQGQLDYLKERKVFYNASVKAFDCRYCNIVIHSVKVALAKRHLSTERHIRCMGEKERYRKLEQNNTIIRGALTKLISTQKAHDNKLNQVIETLARIERGSSRSSAGQRTTFRKSYVEEIQIDTTVDQGVDVEPPMEQQRFSQEPEAQPKVDSFAEAKWEAKLQLKSTSAQISYGYHIREFQKLKGYGSIFTQQEIDEYFLQVKKADDKKPFNKKECKSTKVQRLAALKFFLHDVLNLDIKFKDYSTKSQR